MQKTNDIQTIMKSREDFYHFLSRIYEKEIIAEEISQLKSMPYINSGETDMDEGYSLIKLYLDAFDNHTLTEDLAVDYARVFLAAGQTKGNAAFPYESVYTSKDGTVMQEAWEQVCRIYASKGLELKTEASDIKEDHISVELQFMSSLCNQFKTEGADICLKEQKAFLQNHLLNWAPGFCKDIEEYSCTDFYKGVGELTLGFLNDDLALLDDLIAENRPVQAVSFTADKMAMNSIIKELGKTYQIFAPKLYQKRGAKGQDIVRYGSIESIDDIVYDRKSDFSAKEVYYPIIQTMLYFTGENCVENQMKDDKAILLFVRPCDIHAMSRLDNIFNVNGDQADLYYKRMRDKVKIVMLECKESFKNCFCVSMGANEAQDYSIAVRITDKECFIQVKDPVFKPFFKKEKVSSFIPEFVSANEEQAALPEIGDMETLKMAGGLEFWNQFDEKCIGCGGCNTVCPTCSCFDTVDIIYDETSRDGERRRVWSSCMLDTFTMTAGGGRARKTNGANMRFKTLHKIYDYKKRFKTKGNMCIGCGRCIAQCPQEISFLETINQFHDELRKAKDEAGGR